MTLGGSPLRWPKTAARQILTARVFHASAAAVALAELAAERGTVLAPLYQGAYAIAVVLAFAGAITPPLPQWRGGRGLFGAAWLALTVMALADVMFLQAGIGSFVGAAEALTIGAAAFSIDRDAVASRASYGFLLVAATLMLLLFAWVHLTEADAIAGLVPAWIPGRSQVPFFTGAMMAIGAVGLWLPQVRSLAALLVAGMFLSWLPIVHAERLWNHPGDASEWSFAAMAATLSACMIILMARFPSHRIAQHPASAVA